MVDVSSERLNKDSSYECMEGQTMLYSSCHKRNITSFLSLQQRLNELYATELQGDFLVERRYELQEILSNLDLPCEEICKYGKFSPQLELPYTRNLVYENKHYSILVCVGNRALKARFTITLVMVA